jgi:NAD(P)-dependent dehydrogenase (short-subunit alcohol dehydrogenase family)
MESKMANKIALVTGGARGLGKDMALSLSKKNIDIIITYKSSEKEAEQVVSEIVKQGNKAAALQFDISKFSTLDNFADNFSEMLNRVWNTESFDFLINNAGIGATVPIEQVTEELFDNLLNIHFKGVYFLTQKLLSKINDNGGIIFISSGTTRYCVPGYSVYSSMKGAVEVFTKFVAHEYGYRGIRSNVVAPGPIETDFNNAAIRNNPDRKKMLASRSPFNRVGYADDIGSVVAFLCTNDAKWINGQRIEVSGGINI